MGFLEKIFGRKKETKKPPETPENIELDLDKAGTWFEDEISGFTETINLDAENLIKQIKNISENLESSLQSLETKESEDELKGRMKKLAIDNKTSFIKKVKAFNSSISPPDPKDTLLFSEFCTKIITDINRMTKGMSKNIYFAKMLFAEETNDITAELNSMTRLADEFQKKQDMHKIDQITEVRNLLQEIESLSETQKKGKVKLEQKKQALEILEDEKNKTQKNLQKLEVSEESSRLKQMLKEKDDLNDEISMSRNNIIQIFSPLAKALKKYERFSTLSADDAKILAAYIESPFRALKKDTGFQTLDKITEETEKLITSGKIDLKDRQKEKALARLNALKDHSLLNQHLSEHSRLKEQIKNIEASLNTIKINRETETTKRKLKDIEGNIEDEEQDIQKIEKTRKDTDETICLKTEKLETALSRISGKSISVKA